MAMAVTQINQKGLLGCMLLNNNRARNSIVLSYRRRRHYKRGAEFMKTSTMCFLLLGFFLEFFGWLRFRRVICAPTLAFIFCLNDCLVLCLIWIKGSNFLQITDSLTSLVGLLAMLVDAAK